jgi:putative nucleotidyltransferase with HDIG domain
MPENNVSNLNLIPFDINALRGATRDLTFNIYLKLSDNNTPCIFSATGGLDYKRLAHYAKKGIKELYIRTEDLPAYRNFISKPAESILNNPNTPHEKKIGALLNITEQNMSEIFENFDVSEETAEVTQKVIKTYVNIMVQDPNTLSLLLKLVSHGEYLYYHSIAVSVFSMFVAKACGQFNQRMLELVGQGGFLHDIGSIQLPKEIVCSPNDLNDEQWTEMRKHPQLGLKMVENARSIPDEVRYIIYQHHEEPHGRGYPNGIRGPVIYYPAKIVALADSFSALISKRPSRPAYTVEKAVEILQKAEGKYDREILKIFETIFVKQIKKIAA